MSCCNYYVNSKKTNRLINKAMEINNAGIYLIAEIDCFSAKNQKFSS